MSVPRARRNALIVAAFGLTGVILVSMPMRTAKAQGAKPTQEPITGNEELGDMSQPQQALAQFYHAFTRANRDPFARQYALPAYCYGCEASFGGQ